MGGCLEWQKLNVVVAGVVFLCVLIGCYFRMKILAYTDTFSPKVGGAEMVLHNLASSLTACQHDIHVLAPKARRQWLDDSSIYPVHRYGQPSSKLFLVRQTGFYLAWLQHRYRFDVLHCHAAYPQAYVGATLKRFFNIPMVVRPHGSDIVPGGRMRKNPRIEKRVCLALESADAIIAQGGYLRGVIEDLGIPQDKIVTINNGVNLADFVVSAKFPHPRPYILAIGNIIRRKGFDVLLKAFKGLEDKGVDLLIAGEGREMLHLKTMARELGVDQQVYFLGSVMGQEKIDLYKSALFFVCPSRKEPFANVILEALAAGLPVIASAVDGNVELVQHEKHGLLFPVEDDEALTVSLRRMINEQQLVADFRRAVPLFVRKFDWPVVAQHYLTLYKKVAQG